MSVRVLVTGGNGQVGRALAYAAWPTGWDVHITDHTSCDITDPDAATEKLTSINPQVVINAAAYTAVDAAEADPASARAVNADAVATLGRLTTASGALLIHYSTDYVFDGSADGWYRETDAPNPASVYGATKLAGEQALAGHPRHLILRTSWVHSATGSNFVKAILRRAEETGVLSVIDDQHGCPTAAHALADATVELCRRHLSGNTATGIFHVASPDATTWFDFATAIVEAAGLNDCHIDRTTTAAWGAPAPRPLNSRLDSSKVYETFSVRLPSWRDSLAVVVEQLRGTPPPEEEGHRT